MHPPDPPGPPTGPAAWRALSAWVLGGALVARPGRPRRAELRASRTSCARWGTTMAGAKVLHQLGGATKAFDVAQGFVAVPRVAPVHARRGARRLSRLPPLAAGGASAPGRRAARRSGWRRSGRMLWGAGYVIVYAFLAPYLYLFIPRERRMTGAQLLIWVWAPALVAGAMTAYTSASGYLDSAVGLAPAVVVSGLFLCWALEAVGRGRRTSARRGRADERRRSRRGAARACGCRSRS